MLFETEQGRTALESGRDIPPVLLPLVGQMKFSIRVFFFSVGLRRNKLQFCLRLKRFGFLASGKDFAENQTRSETQLR